MNIFFRDFKPGSPIATGSLWLAALGARIAYALALAVYGRLTSGQAWAVGILTAAWFATSVFPVTAPLAAVINAVLVGFGATRLLGKVKDIGEKLADGLQAAYAANNEAELARAASLLQGGLDEFAMNALTGFVNESTFQAIEKQILKVFPVPEWYSHLFDQGIFYRDFDSKQPVASGSRWFAALAARVAVALAEATKYTNIKRELLLSASQAWLLGLLLAGWIALSLIPATAALADAVNTILLAIGLLSLAGKAEEIGNALASGLRLAYAAQSDDDLERAARLLAPALTDSVIVAIELLVSLAAFRAAEAVVASKLPIPESLARRFARRGGSGRGKPETEGAGPKDEKGGRPSNPPSEGERTRKIEQGKSEAEPAGESKRASKDERLSDAERARRVAATAAKLEGARRTGKAVDGLDVATFALAGVAVVGVGVSVAMLARSRK